MKLYLQLHLLIFLLATTAVLGHLISLPAAGLVAWRTGIASLAFIFWRWHREWQKAQAEDAAAASAKEGKGD